MTKISDQDRSEAEAMSEAFLGGVAVTALPDTSVLRWLAVRDHVLAAHTHTCGPVWRPTTREEIQPGWEVRARRRNCSEAGWGIADNQDDEGDWFTEAGSLLTHDAMGWTCETTAPLPPDPKPDPRAERFAKAMYLAFAYRPWEEISEEDRVGYLRDGAEVLRFFDALTEGGQP